MILEYNPQIYPTRLWVSHLGITEKEYNDMFFFFDFEGNVIAYEESKDGWTKDRSRNACVFSVAHKESGWRGIMVEVDRKVEGDVYAHEATHACDWLFEKLGIKCASIEDDEPRAYYVQWVCRMITKSIKEFRKNKIKLGGPKFVWD